MLHKRGGAYFLFASVGSCCAGLNSTYRTVVGRSDHLFGPYLDRNGKRMLDNGYETVVAGSPSFKGTGHNAELVTDDAGKTWMLYHAYSVREPDKGRLLMLDEVRWDNDGWPYVSEGRPSATAVPGPVWKQ
jgi:arabinan endo-1,5-alpha-L-arabinosidase